LIILQILFGTIGKIEYNFVKGDYVISIKDKKFEADLKIKRLLFL